MSNSYFIRLGTDQCHCSTPVESRNDAAVGHLVGQLASVVVNRSVKWFTLAVCLERLLSELHSTEFFVNLRDAFVYPSPVHIHSRWMVTACVTARVIYRAAIFQGLLPPVQLSWLPTPRIELLDDEN